MRKYIKTFESHEDDSFDKLFNKSLMSGIPTKEFWDFVDRVKWSETPTKVLKSNIGYPSYNYTKHHEEKYLLNNISHTYTWDDMMEFEKIYNNLYKLLDKTLRDAWLSDPYISVSDDSYTDLLSSIIGYGEEFFKSILDDKTFKKVRKMANDIDYKENFGYIFTITLPEIIGEEKWDETH